VSSKTKNPPQAAQQDLGGFDLTTETPCDQSNKIIAEFRQIRTKLRNFLIIIKMFY